MCSKKGNRIQESSDTCFNQNSISQVIPCLFKMLSGCMFYSQALSLGLDHSSRAASCATQPCARAVLRTRGRATLLELWAVGVGFSHVMLMFAIYQIFSACN